MPSSSTRKANVDRLPFQSNTSRSPSTVVGAATVVEVAVAVAVPHRPVPVVHRHREDPRERRLTLWRLVVAEVPCAIASAAVIVHRYVPSNAVATPTAVVVGVGACTGRSLNRTVVSSSAKDAWSAVMSVPAGPRSQMSRGVVPVSTTAMRSTKSGWRPKQSSLEVTVSGQPSEPSRLLSTVAVTIVAGFPSTVVWVWSAKWAPWSVWARR